MSVPCTGVSDGTVFRTAHWTGEQFYQLICDQFDVLYEEAQSNPSMMAIVLHPYLSGHAHRAKWVDRALTHITGHKDIWLTTGGEIAEWFYERYYDNARLAAPLPPRPV